MHRRSWHAGSVAHPKRANAPNPHRPERMLMGLTRTQIFPRWNSILTSGSPKTWHLAAVRPFHPSFPEQDHEIIQ